jgi:autotransporter-associated beta strand protein
MPNIRSRAMRREDTGKRISLRDSPPRTFAPSLTRLAVLTAVTVFGLLLAASPGHAATLVWTNGSDFWQTPTAWTTNGGSTGDAPGPDDTASFTKGLVGTTPARYTVTLDDDVSVNQVWFNNAAGTMTEVTLDLGTNSLSVYMAGTAQPTAFTIADATRCTATVYLASSTIAGKGLFVTNAAGDSRVTIGRNGVATLIVTNGNVTVCETILANGSSSYGALVLSGPNTIWTNYGSFRIANKSGATPVSGLVVSNGASMTVTGQFAVGMQNQASFLMDTGARLFTSGISNGIGNNGTIGNNNSTATIRGGAIWDNGDTDFSIGRGGPTTNNSTFLVSTGNVLSVATGSAVVNINTALVSAANTLDLCGGLLRASVVVSNFGTIRGFGTIVGDTIVASGAVLSVSNSLGPLTFSNSLVLDGNAITKVRLGTNFHSTAVASNLTLDGTLDCVDGGGFTNATYTLFTYGGTLTTNGTATILAIGTTPDAAMSYSVDITSSGQVNLVVWAEPVADFSASPTNGPWPLTVTFTDTSSGTITNQFWDFGDGATTNTTATSLAHTYAAAGTNSVSLTVSGPLGSNILTRSNYILVVNPAQLVVDPASQEFGSVTLGQTNSLNFSVINAGDVTLSGTVTTVAPYHVTAGANYNVAGGETQTVTVAFVPEFAVPFNESVIFSSNGGESTNAVSGTAVTPARISVSPASHNFGLLITGATAQVDFVITNSGGTAVSNGTATVAGGPYSVLSGAGFSLPGFGVTNVVVQFAPTSAGAFTDNVVFATANAGDATNALTGAAAIVPVAGFTGNPTNGTAPVTVTFTDGSTGTIDNRFWDFGDGNTTNTTVTSLDHTYTTGGTYTVSLTMFGPVGTNTQTRSNYIVTLNPAHLVVDPGSLNFGSVTLGQTNSLSFSVINTGDLPLSGATTSAAPFNVTSGGAYNVAGGQTQTVTIAFAPESVATFHGWVLFSSDGGDSINAVSGAGLTPGNISVLPAAHDFGMLVTGATAQVDFVVTNSGGTAVSNGTAAVTGGPFSIVSDATFSVAGFGSTNVTVQFAPVTADAFTNTVVFATANGGDATNTVTGAAAIVPVAEFTASSTNGAAPTAVTFTDASSGTINNRFWVFGDGTTTNTTSTTLDHIYAVAGTNTVSLTVSGPVGTNTQTRTGYIVVVHPAHLVVNPGSLNFGSVTLGQTNTLSFSVVNTGDVSLSGTATSAAPFAVTSGGAYNLANGQTQTVTVTFATGSAATFNESVIFASTGGDSTNSVSGVGLTPGSISASPAAHDFGMLVTGTTAQVDFVVTNSGGTAVSNGTASVTGGPFSILSGATFSVPGFAATNVTVQFAPVSAGAFTGEVSFATANGGAATNAVAGAAAIVPVAAFIASPTNGPWPLVVTFTDNSSGTITSRDWDLGDGTTTNTADTSLDHTYTGAGTNTVSLTVSGPVGTNTQTRSTYIVVINPAHLVVNPGSHNFGSVTLGQTNTLSFSVINTGDVTLSGTATSAAPFAVTTGATYNVAGGQTGTVTVAFAPGSAATFNESVIFASTGGDSTNAVSGVGLTPGSISASPAAHDFGMLVTGTTAQVDFVVTNSGGTAVSNGTATVTVGPFSIVSGATFGIPGFGSTNVTVQFAPVNAGAFTNSVVFGTANGGAATNPVTGGAAIVPVAAFIASPTNGPWPLVVTFTDNSPGTIVDRHWDLGDGATTNTTATSLDHTYGGPGTNTVSLTVSGPVGTNTQTRAGYIVVVNPAHLVVNPDALDFGSVTIAQTNCLSFSVINTGDVPLSGAATSAAPFAVTSGANYTLAGGQTDTVTVAFAPTAAVTFNGLVLFTSANGNSIRAVSGIGLTPGSITVTPASWDFGMVVTGTTAEVSFTVANSGGTAVSNGTVSVTGGPFTVESGAAFGVAGFGSTNVTVRFAPVSAGAFTDNVVFVTANGGLATNTVTGAAAIVPVAGFTGSPTNATVPVIVTFTDASSGTITNRSWDFGDGASTNTAETSLDHTYSAPGTSTVSLTVSGPVGGSRLTRTNYIVAGVPPVADFSSVPTNGLTPLTVTFADASTAFTGGITNRLWDFGDGGTSAATNPSHTYTNAGTYSVSLTVEDQYGTDTKTQTNLIAVYAAAATWTNANVSGNWSEPTNWDPVTVPDFGSSVIFGSGGATATVDAVSRVVGTVTFNRPADFIVDASGTAGLTIRNGIVVATNFTCTISATVRLGGTNTWSVTDGGTLRVSGAVSGPDPISLTGGTVILSGTNAYTGGTMVSAGTLLVNNTEGSGTGTGAVSVASTATLGGHGTIGGPVTISDGGVFSPGDGVGTLTVSNSLAFDGAAVLEYELGTNSDLTVVGGNLILGGILNVADAGGFTNGTYPLFTYGGVLATNGSAGLLTMGTVPDPNMIYTVDISSNGTVNLHVVIPPPVADFSGSERVGMAPFTMTFTNTSSGWVTNSFWRFGDGATSNTMAATVAHTYTAGGNISVQLIVGGPGGVSTNTQIGYLAMAPPCDYPLSGTNASFGVRGGSDVVAVTPYTNVCAWTATSHDAWIEINGGSVSATGSAVVAYTVLSNVASTSSRAGTMTIAGQTFTVIQVGDATSPTVVLTSPATGVVSNTIVLSATATDDVAVVQVGFYRDGGVWLGAVSAPPYTLNFNTATVSDGLHCLYAEARDAAGNGDSSSTNCVAVDNNAPSVPTGLAATAVATNEIKLSWNASNDIGSGMAGYRIYRDGTQIAATAATNFLDNSLATGTEHCYTVAAYDNVGRTSAQCPEACAQSFVTTGSMLGAYHGLAIQTNAPSHASSGSLRLVISRTGAYAAKLSIGGRKITFKGQFDASGNATNLVTRSGLSPLEVILHLDLAYGTDRVTGTISDGVFTSEVVADRATYNRANPCLLAGQYTFVLAPPEGTDPDFPQGYGHGMLDVAETGGAKLSGVLGDGTKIRGNVPVSKHGTWPLYDALYNKQGACIGWVTFGTNDIIEATVDWFRPSLPGSAYYAAGFTTHVTLVGEKYWPASGIESGSIVHRQITLDGGNLSSSIVETVAVDAAGNVSVLSPNNENVTLTLQLRTGRFTGHFAHPSRNGTVGFAGAILQNSNAGAGHFLGTNESGAVIWQPVR